MSWAIEIGCGWLGWTPQTVRNSHLQDLSNAYIGKIKMLQACYGGGEEETKRAVKKQPATLEKFEELFGAR